MNKEDFKEYVPRDQRKKILLLSDDIRGFSGISTIAREIVLNTAHKYIWRTVGASPGNPEKGKTYDISKDINEWASQSLKFTLNDSDVRVFVYDSYGDASLLRQILEVEKPDALFIITDPRYYEWLFAIENEVRKQCPIVYLNIWDELPTPLWNKAFYESCDALFAISKQTEYVNRKVLSDVDNERRVFKYIPHGLNHTFFKPLSDFSERELSLIAEMKKSIFRDREFDFVFFFNSRNIQRKHPADLLLAYKIFVDKYLTVEQAKKYALLLHTDPIDPNGTDLYAVSEALFGEDPKYNIIIDANKWPVNYMSYLYQLCDVVVLPSSNEGWGLSLTEALLSGKPFIATVTGGMQDQMRFIDEEGNWFVPSDEQPSNNIGTKKLDHGRWAFPVYPSNRSLQGSPLTPYIFDCRLNPEDLASKMCDVSMVLTKEDLQERGLEGREWATSPEAGFTSIQMAERIIDGMNEVFEKWRPRQKFELIKVDKARKLSTITHKL